MLFEFPPKMLLTRYLYLKEAVELSLVAALLEHTSLAECYYWLDELLYSGFEVKQLIWKIFYDFYFEYHPKLEYYIYRKTDMRPVVRQLFQLQASPNVFRRRMARDNPPTLETLANGRDVQAYWDGASTYYDDNHRLLAMDTQLRVSDEDIPEITYIIGGSYPKRRQPPDDIRPYNILNVMRQYAVRKDIGAFIPKEARNLGFWEYDAYETPCWKERFQCYGGVPNHEKRRIEFSSDDKLEKFYEKYGYELDEQCTRIQEMSHPHFIDKIEIKMLQIPQPHSQW